MNVQDLQGVELDYWVYKALGFNPEMREVKQTPTGASKEPPVQYEARYKRGELWHTCRPCDQFLRIVDREKICLQYHEHDSPYWSACIDGSRIQKSKFSPNPSDWGFMIGNDPLTAAMRMYVASVYGLEVDEI